MSNKQKTLTRKQLVEHIAKTMPEGLDEIEKAAFIEVEVAKRVWFSEKYLWGKSREKIYKLAKREACNPKSKVKKELICITMAELYVYIAKQFGLNAKYQRFCYNTPATTEIGESEILRNLNANYQEHICPVVKLKDGRTISVDIQDDLTNLQTRSRPNSFGTSEDINELSDLPEEKIDETFKKVYGLKDDEEFTDKYIQELNLKLKECEPLDKIKKFMQDTRIQNEMKNLGCVEARKFCQQILQQILGVPILGTYFHNGTRACTAKCFLESSKGEKKYSIYLYAEDFDQKIFYLLSKKNRQMLEISPGELSQMIEQSMVIPLMEKEPEDNLSRTIIKGLKSYPKSPNIPKNVNIESFFDEAEQYEEK